MTCGPRKTLMVVACATFVTLLYLKKNHGKVANIPLFGKFAEAAEQTSVDTKDCYFDKECHDKVDWKMIEHLKEGFFVRAKSFQAKGKAAELENLTRRAHEVFEKAGMPEDRVDYILAKWVKAASSEDVEAVDKVEVDKKRPVDKKDCYFDKDCHSKVDWNMIGSVKEGFFARAKLLEEQRDTAGVKQLMGRTHGIFAKAGMPEDRIDYILAKWVKFVYPAAFEAGEKGPVDEKDCYFDKDCHGKVDWEKIGSVKRGFFMRVKLLAKQHNTAGVKELMGRMHGIFAKAGMPEDRIDYILAKWARFVCPAALEAETAAEKAQEATEELKVVV